MSGLSKETCVPCSGKTPPIAGEAIDELVQQLDGRWEVRDEKRLEATVRFKDFRSAMDFAVAVGDVAEEAGHHPEICVTWGRVSIRIWTHAIDALSRNDFILAARIDGLIR